MTRTAVKAPGRLGGHVALITGGSRGQGAAHVRRFVAEGACVVSADIVEPEGEADVWSGSSDRVRRLRLDVTSPEDWAAALALTEREFGPLSILVNNAAVYRTCRLLDLQLADWTAILQTNLTGTLLGIQAAAPSMMRRGGGSIINISSTAGLQGMVGLGAYGASKWAVRGLTKTAALELARDGIRVNSVHPGIIRTAMTAQVTDDRVAVMPIDRWGEVEDVAELVLFLASDASSFCTGSEFVIDGGGTTGRLPARDEK